MVPHEAADVELGEFCVSGKCLVIQSLVVDGVDELGGLVAGLLASGEESDGRFLEKAIGFVREVGEKDIAASTRYFRCLRNQDSQWEIRIPRGRQNLRFYGFRVGTVGAATLYIVSVRTKHSDDPDPGVLRRVALVRDLWLQKTDY